MKDPEKKPVPSPCPRTDLALEDLVSPLSAEEERFFPGGSPVTVTRRLEADGSRSVTVACGRITEREEELSALASLLARELRREAERLLGAEPSPAHRILVAGLGNADMTPDAIGPDTVRLLTVTRHLQAHDPTLFEALGGCQLAALSPGTLGQTGMESGDLVAAAAALCRAELVVAVDALAARSCERLASTFQISDRGICPGSGVGNRRGGITAHTVGCPVLALGVPTVVDSSTLVWDALAEAGVDVTALPQALTAVLEEGRSFFVSPKDCDRMVELSCRVLAGALDHAFGAGLADLPS